MRFEPLYTVTFTTPEAWSVEVVADAGIEERSFMLAEGRSTGRLSARYRAANFPRKRADPFARKSAKMGREHRDKSWSDLNESGAFAEHRAYVTGAIFAPVAFLKATINELFADTTDERAVGSVKQLHPGRV
jgi:hypothetical protein